MRDPFFFRLFFIFCFKSQYTIQNLRVVIRCQPVKPGVKRCISYQKGPKGYSSRCTSHDLICEIPRYRIVTHSNIAVTELLTDGHLGTQHTSIEKVRINTNDNFQNQLWSEIELTGDKRNYLKPAGNQAPQHSVSASASANCGGANHFHVIGTAGQVSRKRLSLPITQVPNKHYHDRQGTWRQHC